MLSMLEWLCIELMEVEVDQQLGAEKSQRIVSDENGHRDIITVESMAEESGSSYEVLLQNLEDRSLSTPRLIIMHTPDWFRQFVNPFPTPLGICRDTVYRWERGETLFSSSVLLNLGDIFGVTCDWLVCRSDDPYKTVDGVDIRSVESNLDIGI